jgi:hypothetical protein
MGRTAINIMLDTAVGAVPVVGDAIDVMFGPT